MQDVDAIVKEALAAFAGIDDADQLEQAKARYLGKSGVLTGLLKGLGKLPAAERPAFGSRINAAKESAKRTAAHLPVASSLVGDMAAAGKLKIVAAIYDLGSGAVSYLD